MTNKSQPKPPPIQVSAQGIESKPITMNEPKPDVNWNALIRLPPFQMFVNEESPCPPDRDDEAWAMDFIQRHAETTGTDALLERYSEWHERKGYWPDETPMGMTK